MQRGERRRSYRQPVTEATPAGLRMRFAGGEALEAQLLDSGAGGLACTVDHRDPAAGERVEKELPVISVAALVRNRGSATDECYLGVVFDRARTAAFLETSEGILDFVLDRLHAEGSA